MDTQGKAPEFRVNLPNYLDQRIETTQGKLEKLFKAIGTVGVLSEALNTNEGWELEARDLSPILQSFADLGERLMDDLKAVAPIRGLPSA
jgi:hypothetical protein